MYDELELDKLGDRKTALFLIMSDTDSTFNFLISMIAAISHFGELSFFYQIVQNSTCSGRRNIEKILNTDILDIYNRNPSFTRCRFNLLGDTNAPLGGWLTLLKTNATTREMANCLCSGRRRPAR